MKKITVSIDRIIIDFTDIYWNFFNEFHKRICHLLQWFNIRRSLITSIYV
ncbi:hypothetical protein [Paenibacillus polymyxa]|nr:hypothetical protein [Paenibacillus polymyxa]